MSYLRLAFLSAVLLFAATIVSANEEEAYFGQWSNAAGDELRINADTIQRNDGKPVAYDDITEDSDGSFYLLQLTGPDEANSFKGKFLRITFGDDADQFTMTTYRNQSDALSQQNEADRSEWIAMDEDED